MRQARTTHAGRVLVIVWFAGTVFVSGCSTAASTDERSTTSTSPSSATTHLSSTTAGLNADAVGSTTSKGIETDASTPLGEKESIQAYASSMESRSGISAQAWECVVEDTSLYSWVVTGRTGAFEDPDVVREVFDSLFDQCDARDGVEAYLTEWLIETAGTPSAFAECMSTGLFAAPELEEVARRTAMSALVGVSMAEQVTGEIALTEAGQASYDQLLSRCEA